jgi:hypothetical protein
MEEKDQYRVILRNGNRGALALTQAVIVLNLKLLPPKTTRKQFIDDHFYKKRKVNEQNILE